MTKEQSSRFSCKLTGPELTLRRLTILKEIRNASLETQELFNGFALRLPASTEWKARIDEFISFERQCCSFLSFEIRNQPGDTSVWLHVSGAEGAKEFVRTELMLVE